MYDSKSGMTIPKKGAAPKKMSVSNNGDMSVGMAGVSQKPTKLKNVSKLKGTTNGNNPGSYGKKGY